MRGRQHSRLQVFGRLCGLLGSHVDVGPARVVLAHVERRPIEWAELLADLGEVRPVARVAAEKETAFGRDQRVADPK
ncbi:hypothetical protein D9M68_886000 [compost metagenome]